MAGFILVGTVSAYHFMGLGKTPLTDETKESLNTALENNDYETFVSTRNDYLLNAFAITEEEFDQMRKKHLVQQNIQNTIQNGDYETWKQLMQDNPTQWSEEMLEVITTENFHLLNELETARQESDFETVQEIMEELGLGKGIGFGMRMGNGFHHGMNRMHSRMGVMGIPLPDSQTETVSLPPPPSHKIK